MEILYSSTRGGSERLTASQAILQGLAEDGGLFVPDHIPAMDVSMEALCMMEYPDVAYEVMKLLLTDYTEEELRHCIEQAYDDKFDTEEIAPLREAGGAYYLELFHGATIAFKDMALSILPHLMTTAAKKNGLTEEIVILTATSGDTGKAALAGFADVPGTRICVFYPKHGVSAIQERQMVTQTGENTRVIGIEGNFDDAQTGVKRLFTDAQLRREMKEQGFVFSSANSINIGRLIPQIVYYFYAYTRLLADGCLENGDLINIVVPTGNFGNILAAWYAKQMGLPVKTFLCASNENKVLYDFFETSVYDRNREFILTKSPSMDILVSSNLERLLYHAAEGDTACVSGLMAGLSGEGRYEITPEMKARMKDFRAGYAGEDQCETTIYYLYRDFGYFIDPHTSVGASVYTAYRQATRDETPTVIASTASPYKFLRSVMTAIGEPVAEDEDDFALADRFSQLSGIPVPEAVRSLQDAEIRHDIVVPVDGMEQCVRDFLQR